jgi:serine/threonine protein kinase
MEMLLGLPPQKIIGKVLEDEDFYKHLFRDVDMTAGSWTKKVVSGLAEIAEQCHQYHPHKRSTVRSVLAKLKALQSSAGDTLVFDLSTDRSGVPHGSTTERRLRLAKQAEYDEASSAPANAAAKKLVVLDWNSGAASSVVSLPFAELEAATHSFDEFNELGQGGSCVVYKGHLFGKEVAVKRLNSSTDIPDGGGSGHHETQLFEAEMKLLTGITHGNICRLLAFSTDGPSRCLVMELCTGGALNDRLACRAEGRMALPPLQWQHRLQIALSIAEACVHLHVQDPPVIHRYVASYARQITAAPTRSYCGSGTGTLRQRTAYWTERGTSRWLTSAPRAKARPLILAPHTHRRK